MTFHLDSKDNDRISNICLVKIDKMRRDIINVNWIKLLDVDTVQKTV